MTGTSESAELTEKSVAPGRAKRGPSIADVALQAGVSAQTVSRVSNGLSNVEEKTRLKVEEAMKVLGYRPNRAARALKSGRFKSIGVIMFSLSSIGNMKTLDAIVSAASEQGYTVNLIPMPHPSTSKFPGAYSRLREQQVDGLVIIFDAQLIDHAAIDLPQDLPAVVIDSDPIFGYTMVDTDQVGGARVATEYLLALGHANVWHIAGPQTSFSATHRAEGWSKALLEAGIEPPEIVHGDWSADSGYQAGLSLGARPEVTAIFAANDQMALGVLRALHELGRQIPQDVSVVGFDDVDEATSYWPPLTTVQQDFSTVGKLSMEALFQQISGTEKPLMAQTVPTRLVVRDSTGAIS